MFIVRVFNKQSFFLSRIHVGWCHLIASSLREYFYVTYFNAQRHRATQINGTRKRLSSSRNPYFTHDRASDTFNNIFFLVTIDSAVHKLERNFIAEGAHVINKIFSQRTRCEKTQLVFLIMLLL